MSRLTFPDVTSVDSFQDIISAVASNSGDEKLGARDRDVSQEKVDSAVLDLVASALHDYRRDTSELGARLESMMSKFEGHLLQSTAATHSMEMKLTDFMSGKGHQVGEGHVQRTRRTGTGCSAAIASSGSLPTYAPADSRTNIQYFTEGSEHEGSDSGDIQEGHLACVLPHKETAQFGQTESGPTLPRDLSVNTDESQETERPQTEGRAKRRVTWVPLVPERLGSRAITSPPASRDNSLAGPVVRKTRTAYSRQSSYTAVQRFRLGVGLTWETWTALHRKRKVETSLENLEVDHLMQLIDDEIEQLGNVLRGPGPTGRRLSRQASDLAKRVSEGEATGGPEPADADVPSVVVTAPPFLPETPTDGTGTRHRTGDRRVTISSAASSSSGMSPSSKLSPEREASQTSRDSSRLSRKMSKRVSWTDEEASQTSRGSSKLSRKLSKRVSWSDEVYNLDANHEIVIMPSRDDEAVPEAADREEWRREDLEVHEIVDLVENASARDRADVDELQQSAEAPEMKSVLPGETSAASHRSSRKSRWGWPWGSKSSEGATSEDDQNAVEAKEKRRRQAWNEDNKESVRASPCPPSSSSASSVRRDRKVTEALLLSRVSSPPTSMETARKVQEVAIVSGSAFLEDDEADTEERDRDGPIEVEDVLHATERSYNSGFFGSFGVGHIQSAVSVVRWMEAVPLVCMGVVPTRRFRWYPKVVLFVLFVMTLMAGYLVRIEERIKYARVSECIYAMTAFAGLFMLRWRGVEQMIGPKYGRLQAYARLHGFRDDWTWTSIWSLLPTFCIWISVIVLPRVAVLGDDMQCMSTNDWFVMEGHYLSFIVPRTMISALVFCLIHLLTGLELMVDNFCIRFMRSPDFAKAVPEWNAMQAILRLTAYIVEESFMIIQIGTLAVFTLKGAEILVGAGPQEPCGATSFAVEAPMLLLALQAIYKAARVTEKCSHTPALVNSLMIKGIPLHKQRQYVVNYIEQSAAGFYAKGVRINLPLCMKLAYIVVMGFFACLSRIAANDVML